MIKPGRDRYCQKVTRRQGNGLLQPARFDEEGGGERKRKKKKKRKRKRKDPQEDGETGRTITMKGEKKNIQFKHPLRSESHFLNLMNM